MTYLIALSVYTAALFVLAWLSRRAMAVPTLALAAGALIASLWTDSLTPLVAQTGVVIVRPPLTSLVSIGLTLLPACLVMVRAHKASSSLSGIVSSMVFAVLGVMLTYGAFSNAVALDEASRQVTLTITRYQSAVITVCVCVALGEVLMTKRSGKHHEKRH